MKDAIWKWLKFLAFNPVLFMSALFTFCALGTAVFAFGVVALAVGEVATQLASGAIGWSGAWAAAGDLFPAFALGLFFAFVGVGSWSGLRESWSNARDFASDAIDSSQRAWTERVEREEAQEAQGGMLSMSTGTDEQGGLSAADAPAGSLEPAPEGVVFATSEEEQDA